MKPLPIRFIAALYASALCVSAEFLQAETLSVDGVRSSLAWTAEKVTGAHHGQVPIKSGSVQVENGRVEGGRFEIDMTGIVVQDIKDPKYNAKLTNHLKSEDFFNAGEFPTSSFVITKALFLPDAKPGEPNYTITGDLTIKAVTLPLSFPAEITFEKSGARAIASTKVDRTKYNVRYGSGKFFENLGDKLIYDEFLVELDITAS